MNKYENKYNINANCCFDCIELSDCNSTCDELERCEECYVDECLEFKRKANVENYEKVISCQNNNLNDIIKHILKIICNHKGNKLSINIWPPNEIYFYIYESEIPICINIKEKYAYIDTETINNHLSGNMLNELSQIIKIIENNIDVILDCLVFNK